MQLLNWSITKIFANKEDFALLEEIKNSNTIKEEVLQRYLYLVHNKYAGNQYDEEILQKIQEISSKIEQKYSTYRAELNGKQVTDNEIEKILTDSTDSVELQAAWEASKQIGSIVNKDMLELVNLRNKAAQSLGYNNYFEKSFSLNEQNADEIEKLFDELDELTKDEFAKIKNNIDTFLAARLKIDKSELKPWHYQERFFQHSPAIFSVDLDKYFEDKDLVKITRNFFDSINLNIDDLLEKSDLFEKEGKISARILYKY